MCSTVYHPSRETALPCYQINIAARVLVFIKNYQAQVWGVVIFITLLVGFVPLLQVTFFALLEDFYMVWLTVKDRDKTHRITGVILIKHHLLKFGFLLLVRFNLGFTTEGILATVLIRPSSWGSQRAVLTSHQWHTNRRGKQTHKGNTGCPRWLDSPTQLNHKEET
jgi:hypothetical protein